ncbi:SirB2 family protein [Iodobacter sp. HSC-16F04]|uniref:SirB2 family protein n=1 Tax=Iodobacter violaceini TaxID=3044271 RepID=A0ABX0L228_9NEIS|nr:SirB2 family protein [Iodobacter violacea]NHQ87466.1 SirB2 family protein [Iodobacter violacea]
MEYLAVKHLHMLFITLSLGLFLLRGCLMLAESPRLQQRFFRIAPHIIDTALLISGISLAMMYPGPKAWLAAKVAGLLLYIILGTIALKRGKTKTIRSIALAASVLAFAYIIGVAFSKSALLGLV